MALPRAYRLNLRLDRDHLRQAGTTYYGQFFTVVAAPQEPLLTHSRFAITTSKKTASLAVDRNRIKRITSSLLLPHLEHQPPKDFLLIPKRSILTTSHQALLSDLSSLFSKIS